jgi:hypothetical protein
MYANKSIHYPKTHKQKVYIMNNNEIFAVINIILWFFILPLIAYFN